MKAAAYLPFFLIAMTVYSVRPERPSTGQAELPWFSDLAANADELPPEFGRELLGASAAFLFDGLALDGRFSRALTEDRAPRIIFLSVSNGREKAQILIGQGIGLRDAWRHAMRQALPILRSGYPLEWAKLDIVDRVRAIEQAKAKLVVGVEGLAFPVPSRLAWLPAQLMAENLVRPSGELNAAAMERHFTSGQQVGNQLARRTVADAYLFSTKQWLISGNRSKALAVAESREINAPSLAQIDADIAALSDQLLGITAESGLGSSLAYADRAPVRDLDFEGESLAILAALAAYDLRGQEDYLRFARARLNVVVSTISDCVQGGVRCGSPTENSLVWMVDAAWSIIAAKGFMDRSQVRSMVPLVRTLANTLMDAWLSSPGLLAGTDNSFDRPVAHAEVSALSLVLFALMQTEELDLTGRWHAVALAIGSRLSTLVETRSEAVATEMPMWLVAGLGQLGQRTGDLRYGRAVQALIETIMDADAIDYPPGYRFAEAGAKSELFLSAARAVNLTTAAKGATAVSLPQPIGKLLAHAVQKLLRFRVEQDVAMYFDRPDAALNRLQKSPTEIHMPEKDLAIVLVAIGSYRQYLAALPATEL